MLTIVQRGGATREKPPEAVRGQASRLPWAWSGLCFAAPFSDATRDAARDLVVNAPPSTSGSVAWARDNRGNTAVSLGTSSHVSYADNPAHNKPSTSITAYVRLRRTGTPDTFGGIFSKTFAAEPIFWESWCIQDHGMGDNSLHASMAFDSDHVQVPDDAWPGTRYSLPTTTWVSVFMRWISGGPVRLDILGERGESLFTLDSAPYTGTISYGTTTDPIRINGNNDVTTNFNADYSQAMLWSRRLTDTELQALVSDPYGWYSPRRETIGLSSPYPLLGYQSFMREVSSG